MKVLQLCCIVLLHLVGQEMGQESDDPFRLTLVDGEYDNVVVTVVGDLTQDIEIFKTNLNNLLEETSSVLMMATSYQVRFGKVTVYVPEDWPYEEGEDIGSEYLASALAPQMLVGNSLGGSGPPWTQQRLPCGYPGDFIYVPLNFISDSNYFGAGKKMTQEWAKYRWGVMSEHGSKDDKLYPLWLEAQTEKAEEDPKWELNLCVDSEGDFEYHHSGDECPDCTPIITESNVNSSIMSLDKVSPGGQEETDNLLWESVELFCDAVTHQHNPSRQNNLCQDRSAWEVMEEHPDFQNVTISSSSESPVRFVSPPSIEYVRLHREYIVLLIEYTKVLTSITNRWGNVLDAVSQFILHELAWGSKVWLVVFNEEVYTVVEEVLTTYEIRLNAVKTFRDFFNSYSPGLCRSLYKAVGKAASILPDDVVRKIGYSKMVILTRPPDLHDTMDDYFCEPLDNNVLASLQAGYQTNSILYPVSQNSKSDVYDNMAVRPTGEVFTVNENSEVKNKLGLLLVLQQIDKATLINHLQENVPVSASWNNGECFWSFPIPVDTTLPAYGYIALHHPFASDTSFEMSLFNTEEGIPMSQNLLLQSPSYEAPTGTVRGVTFTTTGQWSVKVLTDEATCKELALEVRLEEPSRFAQVLEKAGLTHDVRPSSRNTPSLVALTAAATKRNYLRPALLKTFDSLRISPQTWWKEVQKKATDCSVHAWLSLPAHEVDLSDIQNPVVITAKVSCMLTQTEQPVEGATVEAFVTNGKGTELHIVLRDNGSGAPDSVANDSIYSAYWVMGDVREPTSFLLNITASKNDGDADFSVTSEVRARVTRAGNQPPAKVADLWANCTTVNTTHSSINLSFTAPGSQLDMTPASQYRVWYNSVLDGIDTEGEPNLISADSMVPGGERKILQVDNLPCDTTMFFFVRATSNTGVGDNSNLARAYCRCKSIPLPNKSKNVGGIIGGVIGGLSALIVIAIIAFGMKTGRIQKYCRRPDPLPPLPSDPQPLPELRTTKENTYNIPAQSRSPPPLPPLPPNPPTPQEPDDDYDTVTQLN